MEANINSILNYNPKFKRGSIRICDLSIYKSKVKHLQNGLRPAIIISNNANNYHSPVIQIIPLTTEVKKNLPTHVNLDIECGLLEPSVALCEAETSIDISFIGEEIGVVTEDKMIEIEKAIKIQHGITETFNLVYVLNIIENIKSIVYSNDNYNSEELKTILCNNLNNYLKTYEYEFEAYMREQRNICIDLYENKEDYILCLKECKYMLKIIEFLDNTYNKWFYHFRLAMCYFKLNNYKKAIKYCGKTVRYTIEYDDYKYTECLWLLALCNKKLNNNKEALRYYNKCIKFYTKLNLIENLTDVIYNKGVLLKSYTDIKRALEIRLKHNFDSNKYILHSYYDALFELSINSNIDMAKEHFYSIDMKYRNKSIIKYLYENKLYKILHYLTINNFKLNCKINTKYKLFKLKKYKI